MSRKEARSGADYGTWVGMKLIVVPLIVGAASAALGSLFWPLWILAGLGLLLAGYFAYARHEFSPRGGNVQARIWELVLDRLDWNGVGEVLDIGCGSGALAIELAKRYPHARMTGIDCWGGMWEYSKETCERNARAEGVDDRVRFQRASASDLPFEDGTFDAAVSNFVFHEVKDTKDKRALLNEGLRVVKKGGAYAFHDLFQVKAVYGEVDDLLEAIRGWGIGQVAFVDTKKEHFLPKLLRNPIFVGAIGLIHGRK
jgi:SAM-dependent methyltransferase